MPQLTVSLKMQYVIHVEREATSHQFVVGGKEMILVSNSPLSKQEVGEILQSGLVRQLKIIQILLMISHYLPFETNLHPQSLLT